ncbi:hypothetical protein GCM10011505_26410 [Tistrella bauzanensis]|uniref:Uncharacterized protein n=1 Tax=Tistrella bauzanensis TaxID=657419 RepID=A0ABQ1ILD6_9PROT|nr:hypothetical protein GCM10011505_26410 [Tistrella bauzanensis]
MSPTRPFTRHDRALPGLPGLRGLIDLGAWLLAVLWALPVLYAIWTAFHPGAYATRFSLFAPLRACCRMGLRNVSRSQ